jgi:hypothetical protein
MRRATTSQPQQGPKNASSPIRRRDEKRNRPIALISLVVACIIVYGFFGYNRLEVLDTSPLAEPSVPSRTKSSSEIESTPTPCKILSIYPPHLLPQEPLEKLCGVVFAPLQFANQAPSNYDWKATGFDYYATGIGLHHVTFDTSTRTYDGKRHNLVYNSMMKCGSTSVNRALKELAQSAKERFVQTIKVVYQGKQNNLLAARSQRIMDELHQHQQQPNNATHTYEYFTTVRDPVARFVSAIAQEMYVRRNDPKAQAFRDNCLLESPRLTLECSIRHVRERFSGKVVDVWLDQPHFIPMTTVLYKRSYGRNVQVTLFPIDQVNRIVSQMVAPSRQDTWETKKNKLKAQGSVVLKNMTIADLTDGMIDEVCHLYALDVKMMKAAGFATLCP